jgi:hypothetical protein
MQLHGGLEGSEFLHPEARAGRRPVMQCQLSQSAVHARNARPLWALTRTFLAPLRAGQVVEELGNVQQALQHRVPPALQPGGLEPFGLRPCRPGRSEGVLSRPVLADSAIDYSTEFLVSISVHHG